jgi:hypothetical protein
MRTLHRHLISHFIFHFIRHPATHMAVEFEHQKWAARVKRRAERGRLDDPAIEQVLAIVDDLRPWVAGWGVYETVMAKIARAIVEGKISPVRVGEIIETIIVRRRQYPEGHDYHIPEPGRYFVRSIMEEFTKAGEPWNWRDRKED